MKSTELKFYPLSYMNVILDLSPKVYDIDLWCLRIIFGPRKKN